MEAASRKRGAAFYFRETQIFRAKFFRETAFP